MKVSICIPAYRQVDYLRETLRSLLEQDFADYEVIISDDSPDDSVRNLLAEFSFDGRLRYLQNTPALGSPENWNAAIRMAMGEYVKILHHDDHFTRRDALRKFVQLLDDNPEADFGFSATIVNHVDSGIQRVHCPTSKQLADLAADPASLFVGNCIGAPSATICRQSVHLDYDHRMKWLVDIDHYYRVLMHNACFAFTPETLITTPTNVGHQVTETCRNDGGIELGEAMLLFEKFTPAQRENPLVKQGWMILFRRFRMRKLRDFARYGLPIPSEEGGQSSYFTDLLRRQYTIWHLLMDPPLLWRKIVHRIYINLPNQIIRLLKNIRDRVNRNKFPSL